jgi:hypothetical protein
VKLDGLTVEELESLQERVSKALTDKVCERVKFTEFDFCPCDDRSMGSVKFGAQTKHGLLEYSANLGNGYTDDVKVSLNGVESDGYDLEVPGFHDNTTNDVAVRECAKALLEWESSYEPAEVEA